MASKKALTGKHNYAEFKEDTVRFRVKKMTDLRDAIKDATDLHVRLSYGNRKTGALVPSVSLIPVADCGNCKVCSRGCYDVRNVCFQKTVQKSRAINSAIYEDYPLRYFTEIQNRVKFLRFFRWHIGGDIKSGSYLEEMVRIALVTPTCEFLAFTKMYDTVNGWLDRHPEGFPKNLHIIFSDWRGAEFENPYNLPVSSPLWADGTKGPHCTDKEFMCPGLCEECAEAWTGCWAAKSGDTILFEAH